MAHPETRLEETVGKLIPAAKDALHDLLSFAGAKTGQLYMRLAVRGEPGQWQCLSDSSNENDRLIKATIAQSDGQVTGMVIALLGTVNWRGGDALMARLQYFSATSKKGLIIGSHLVNASGRPWLKLKGEPIVMGSCLNVWI